MDAVDVVVEDHNMDIAQLLQRPDTTVAVVGATDNRHKYGSVIYRDLKAKGYDVFPVNPHRETVDGDPAYPDLASLPEPPTIVNIVVPPQETLGVLQDAAEHGIRNVWIQPGAENEAVYDYLAAGDFNALVGACIMVRSRVLSDRQEPSALGSWSGIKGLGRPSR